MKYYLYKKGALIGPMDAAKIEALRESKKILDYQWIIDSEAQVWKSVCEAPKENPFLVSKKSVEGRTLSAAFFLAKEAYTGAIQQLHSFGVEIVLQNRKQLLRGISESKSIFLNLCDETNFTFVNAKAILQSQEVTPEGLRIRFNWDQQEVSL